MFKKSFVIGSLILLLSAFISPNLVKAEGEYPEFINFPDLVSAENKEGVYHLIKLYQFIFGNITPGVARIRSHVNLHALILFYEQSCYDLTPDACMRNSVPTPPCNCSLPPANPPTMNMTPPSTIDMPFSPSGNDQRNEKRDSSFDKYEKEVVPVK